MKNIDIILRNFDGISGTQKIVMRQAELMSKTHDVSVIAESLDSRLSNKPNLRYKKVLKWPSSGLFQRRFFDWEARQTTRKNSLIIGHGDSLFQNLLFLHTCVHKGAEVAPGPHNKKNYSIPFHKMIFEKGHFDEIICDSEMMKDDLRERFNITKPMHVIYPAFDSTLFEHLNQNSISEIRAALKVKNEELVIGVVASGNLENRGAFALLRAMAFLNSKEKENIKILIIGNEGKPSRIYNLANEVGMNDRVLWMKPRPDVGNIISAIDIVVHAANIEAAGITFLEGMALSKPMIGTRTVGFTAILPEIQKSLIIDKQDPQLIAEKLKILINNPSLCTEMGKQNHQIALKYTWEKYDEKFLDIVKPYLL